MQPIPDDEVLGAGATWHKHTKQGDKVTAVIISSGRTDPLDQRFETIPLKDFITTIEKVVANVKPDIVYTHIYRDINYDHRVVHDAVKVACRPTRSPVKAIYAFNSSLSPFDTFHPLKFIRVSQNDIQWKVDQMKLKYPQEMDLPYRNEEGIITQAKFWGSQIGVEYAEAFEVIIDTL